MPASEVTNILHDRYGWVSTGDVEQPDEGVVEEALQTLAPRSIAEALDTAVRATSEASTAPAGIEVWGRDGAYLYTRHRIYSGSNHMRATDTAQALGLQPPDPPVDTIGEARTVSQWWEHQERLRNRLGEPLCDAATFAARSATASRPPLEWLGKGMDPLIWQLLVREGFPPVSTTAYIGLSAQQALDNLRAIDGGYGRDAAHPLPWPPVKPASKVPA